MTEAFILGWDQFAGFQPNAAIYWGVGIALGLAVLAFVYRRIGPRRLFQGLREGLRAMLSIMRAILSILGWIIGWDRLSRSQRFMAIYWGIRIALGLGVLAFFFSLLERVSNIPALTLAQLLFTVSIPVVIALVGIRYTQQRAQDDALQGYLDQMSSLLLEEDLRASEEGSEVRTLARARTLTVLGRLNGGYKRVVILFLSEAALVQRVAERNPIIKLSNTQLYEARLEETDLNGADLSEANLDDAWLRKANLSHANLSGASLAVADLEQANLSHANLSEAFLQDANLSKTDLSHANLRKTWLGHAKNLKEANLICAAMQEANLHYADLEGCSLQGVNLSNAGLERAKLKGAHLKGSDLREADLRGADLTDSDLSDTCLAGAKLLPYYSEHAESDLSDVDLSVYDDELSDSTQLENVNLSGADLTEADLRRVNLRDATGWTVKQLTAAKSLEGATMPNGQKYEDWLKSREEENSGSQ